MIPLWLECMIFLKYLISGKDQSITHRVVVCACLAAKIRVAFMKTVDVPSANEKLWHSNNPGNLLLSVLHCLNCLIIYSSIKLCIEDIRCTGDSHWGTDQMQTCWVSEKLQYQFPSEHALGAEFPFITPVMHSVYIRNRFCYIWLTIQ